MKLEEELRAIAKQTNRDRFDLEAVFNSHFNYYLSNHSPQFTPIALREEIYKDARKYALIMVRRHVGILEC